MQALPRGASIKVFTTSCGTVHDATGVTPWTEDDTSLEEISARWARQAGADVSAGFFPLLVRPVGGPGFELHVDGATRAAIAQDLNAAAVNDTAHIRQVFALDPVTFPCTAIKGSLLIPCSVCSWLLTGEVLLHQCSCWLTSLCACAHA